MSEHDSWTVGPFSQESVCIRDVAPAWREVIIRGDWGGHDILEPVKKQNKAKHQPKKQFCSLEKANDCETGAGAVLRFLFWLLLSDPCMSHMGEGKRSPQEKTCSSYRIFGETAALGDTLYSVKLSPWREAFFPHAIIEHHLPLTTQVFIIDMQSWHCRHSRGITKIVVSICARPWQPPNLFDVAQFPFRGLSK